MAKGDKKETATTAIIANKKVAANSQARKDKLGALEDSLNRKRNSRKPIRLKKSEKKELRELP
jgi:uncharacterized lipoprotein NlpE involved in copper resistance